MDHLTGHIGQPEVTAGITVGEAFVIDAQQVQNRGVQIVDVDSIMDGAKTEVVRFAVRHATFDASAGHPCCEAEMIVITTVAVFGRRRAAKFAAPQHQRFIQQSALEAAEFRRNGISLSGTGSR